MRQPDAKMTDEDRITAKDGYSARPSLYRALGVTLIAVVMWVSDVPRSSTALLGGLVAAAWVTHAAARRREASNRAALMISQARD